MQLLKDDVLLGSAVDVSAIAPLDEEIKGDSILSYASDTRSASQLGASSSFISTFDGLSGQVGTIDPSAKFTQIASTFSFSDIAVSKDGTIFGITPTQLFKIDPVSGLTSFVGGLPAGVNMNALEFANDVLYGAGDSNLYAINTTNAGVYLIANLESTGFNSSGDLAFDAPNNRFLATSKGLTSDSLYAVSLTGEAAKIGDIGFSNILALMFEGEKLFGFTADGSRIAINPGTGAGVFDTLVKGISDRIGGASGIQIKKGEVLSSTPGTILSADTIDVFLPPGGEITLEITVTVPGDGSEPIRSVRSIENGDRSASVVTNQLPLDVFLLQDLSGSFDDDLPTVRRLVPNLVSALQKRQPDSTFGVASFTDKPIAPFGISGDYVYRLNQQQTTDATAIQSTVNNLTVRDGSGGEFDGPEAQLEGLLQTALRSQSEIGFRDSARRVVVVATDAEFHQAGDGRKAGITKPNNLDTILDGNPPGTGEDYPSVPQVRQALINANIIPVFAVTKDQIATYRDLVDDSDGDGLGFGSVVELKSDSSNLVDAIATGLDVVGREINVVPVSDEFGYVKEITPPKFTDVLPGQKLTFRVKLKSDGKGGNDTLNLRALGFGDTKINIVTSNKPPNTSDSKRTGKITNTYVTEVATGPFGLFRELKTEIEEKPVSIRKWENPETPVKPDEKLTQAVKNVETYVIIHGWNNDEKTATIAELAKQIGSSIEQGGKGKQVILIDWKDAAATGPAPGNAALWIHDVADFAVKELRNTWKIDPQNINLIGHSLGTLVASEIGFLFATRNPNNRDVNTIDRDIEPGEKVNSIIALDPPGEAGSANFFGYDLDNDAQGTQSPLPFRQVSNFSRAFWGRSIQGNGLGAEPFAHNAQESFEIKFLGSSPLIDGLSNHGNIINLFKNMLASSSEKISRFFQLDQRGQGFKPNSYSGGDEGIIVADKGLKMKDGDNFESKPALLIVKNQDRASNNDEIVYATNGDDKLLTSSSSRSYYNGGNDIVYGQDGNDEIEGIFVNDTIYGGKGNDKLSGRFANDSLFGDAGDDTLIGAGSDGEVPGTAGGSFPGTGEIDNLTGGPGADTFILGESDQVYYAGAPLSTDYALINDFNPSEGDIIQLARATYFLDALPALRDIPAATALKAIYLDRDGIAGGSDKDDIIAIVQSPLSLFSGAITPSISGFKFV